MKRERIERDNQKLIEFWNQVFALSEEQKTEIMNLPEDWKELAPSEKLFQAACSLGQRKKYWTLAAGQPGLQSLQQKADALM